MYLSSTERRQIALARGLEKIHDDFRDEALDSYFDSSSPLILNNAGQRFHSHRAPHDFSPVQHLRGCPIEPDLRQRPWALRNWLYAMWRNAGLRDRDLSSLSPENIWRWIRVFRESVRVLGNIENDDYRPLRKQRYVACGSRWSSGGLVTYADGSKRVVSYSCSETACTRCYDADKARTAHRYLNKILALSDSQQIDRFWSFVVTLPEEVEAMIPYGSTTRKKFMNELCKWVRKLFGLRAKDGLFCYANIHPVGDSDLMRDRFHVHIGLLPFAVRRLKEQIEFIQCDVEGLIDTETALSKLEQLLWRVFPLTQRGKAQFKAQYIPLREKSTVPRLAHRLKYDLRGFEKDVELAPLFFDESSRMVVLKSGEEGYGIYTVDQIADRWRWIRSQRDLRPYGLLKQWNQYADILGIEFEEDPEPEIEEEQPIIIKRVYGRQWNPKKRQVRWTNEKRAYWKQGGTEIKDFKWGRKGSEGFWKPRANAPSTGAHET